MRTRKRQTLIQQSRRVSSEQKARYHELEGAGRRRVKREFFGLNRADEGAVEDRIQRFLDATLRD